MSPLLMLILWVCIALVVFLAIGITRRKPEPVQLPARPKPDEIAAAEVEAPAKEEIEASDVGRGAAAILACTRRARVLAAPHHKAPANASYHVKRQANRELAVVIRLHSESATDRIVAQFPPDGGVEAWEERNRLQYGTAGAFAEMAELRR